MRINWMSTSDVRATGCVTTPALPALRSPSFRSSLSPRPAGRTACAARSERSKQGNHSQRRNRGGLRGASFGWCLVLWALLAAPAWAQQDGVLQIGDPIHRFLERQQTAGRLPRAFLLHQPLSAGEARRYLDTLAARGADLSASDRRRLARYRGEAPAPGATWAHGRAPFVYANGHDLFAIQGDGYGIQVNPLLYVSYGVARQSEREEQDPVAASWAWSRGVRVSGHLTDHVFFETRLTENLERLAWAKHGDGTAPRLGFISLHDGAVGYFSATGLVGLRTRFFEVRFGRDRNRWGPGTGSLILSNYASVYDHLQLRTTVGPFQYVNVFAGLSEPRLRPPGNDFAVPRKYAALHSLAVDLPGRVQLSFFESVLFGSDSLGMRKGFDLSYLNPVIFYRAVERDRGSPDNVLLGTSASWIPYGGVRLYTQFMLDELKVDEIGKGWWGNKWGWLAGVHLADLPVPDLSLRLEYARLRPYLYSHRTVLTDYVHYNDLLGHPVGPNAQDLALFVDYQPSPRLFAMLNLAFTRRGRNTATENFGGDPLATYDTRVKDTDVRMLQGIRQSYLLLESTLGYEVLPGLFIEAVVRAESLRDAETGRDRYVTPSVLLRWNTPYQSLRY